MYGKKCMFCKAKNVQKKCMFGACVVKLNACWQNGKNIFGQCANHTSDWPKKIAISSWPNGLLTENIFFTFCQYTFSFTTQAPNVQL